MGYGPSQSFIPDPPPPPASKWLQDPRAPHPGPGVHTAEILGGADCFLSGVCLIFHRPGPTFSSKGLDTRLGGWEAWCPRAAWGRCVQASSGRVKGAGSRVIGSRSPPPKDADLTLTAEERPSAGELGASGGRRRPRRCPWLRGLAEGCAFRPAGTGRSRRRHRDPRTRRAGRREG